MPASEQKRLSGIFISYRRSDTPDAVGRIYDRLISEFGKARVFKDVDSIPLGQDFRSHLNDIVGNCVAVLAIIGPKWVDTRNAGGQRRLEDPDDFVRVELEAALARNVAVVPVLVGHAPMPGSTELPISLASMAFRQSIEVRPDPDFHNDATRLVSALHTIIDPNAPRVVPRTDKPRSWAPWLATLAAATSLAAIAFAIPALKHLREVPPPEFRTEVVTPATSDPTFALSPDGRAIVYVAKDGELNRLWLRNLSTSTARPLPGTDGATGPFWSPDGQSIGYFANYSLKRLDIASGQGRMLTAVGPVADGTWNADGIILYVTGPASPLMRISANGGEADVLVPLGELHIAIRFPMFLPDGRHFLFRSMAGSTPGIYLGSLAGNPPVRLTTDLGHVAYLSSGWMLWNREGTLLAQRLDLEKGALVGEVATVADNVDVPSTSANGLVAYRGIQGTGPQLNWRDRNGGLLGAIGELTETYSGPSVSPDGRRVAVTQTVQGKADIWLLDGKRRGQITFDGKGYLYPNWSPDGERIVHLSVTADSFEFYLRSASGAGEPEPIFASALPKFPSSWSADGRYLLYFTFSPATGADLAVLPMNGNRKPSVLLATSNFEVWPRFSPDGRWVAYTSNESGRAQVYVRPFIESGPGGGAPGLGSGRWQVSTAGGIMPNWRRDGRELFFLGPAGEMMASTIEVNGATLTSGTPVKLFDTRVLGRGSDDATGRQYDVSSDGRFLINEVPEAQASAITLIQNWNPDAGK
jgi:eukaryotic-like serine/threonine-protein kinase